MIDDDFGAVGGIRIGRGNRSTQRNLPSATLLTTNPTWTDLGSNPGRRGGKSATNPLNSGNASSAMLSAIHVLF
jgi:hypothetical protein